MIVALIETDKLMKEIGKVGVGAEEHLTVSNDKISEKQINKPDIEDYSVAQSSVLIF